MAHPGIGPGTPQPQRQICRRGTPASETAPDCAKLPPGRWPAVSRYPGDVSKPK